MNNLDLVGAERKSMSVWGDARGNGMENGRV